MTMTMTMAPESEPPGSGSEPATAERKTGEIGETEKVAIIGSGMAGLVTAHLLSRARDLQGGRRFEVEVLEMQDVLSLDSASYSLPSSTASASRPSKLSSGSNSRSRASSETLVSLSLCAEKKAVDQKGAVHEVEDVHGHAHANGNGNEIAIEKKEKENGQRVDLPMRAFAAGYYDNLLKMYTYLGVKFAEPRFVYSLSTVSADSLSPSAKVRGKGSDGAGQAYFIHSSNNHILPPIRPDGVGLLTYLLEIMYLLFWYAWFTGACFFVAPKSTPSPQPSNSHAKKPTPSGTRSGSGETLASYLHRIHIPTYYRNRYFLPLMSSITTCTHEQLLEFPASDIIGYAVQTFRKPHYTVTGGVQEAEGRLAGRLTVRFGTRVTSVESIGGRDSNGSGSGRVRVSWASRAQAQEAEQGEGEGAEKTGENVYDRVIIAVTPDVLGKIFAPLRESMKLVPTTKVATIVHRDFDRVRGVSASMGDDKRLQRRNFRSLLSDEDKSPLSTTTKLASTPPSSSASPPLTAMHMLTTSYPDGATRTESIHEHPANVLVSTYAMDGIAEERILHRVQFTRVLRDSTSRDVVNSIFDKRTSTSTSNLNRPPGFDGFEGKEKEKITDWKSGDGNVHVVGGWCWDGMVLLEGCIVSAMRVAEDLGVEVPWLG
ncbi:uncharacterized protein BDV17DRAFT_57123 [Aspergillus undulatus]|uniref:uncharacterized protein n=1 Tax=Aspergillus undulatus TaxID=1810928 RepID=UPI003CCD3707